MKFTGLTTEEVEERKQKNQINYDTSVPTKSIKRILKDNIFTLFNLINLVLGIAVFAVGSYKNSTFLLIAIINTAISTIQEIHSKRIVDKLSLMSESKAKVIRNNKYEEISIHELVLDDIIELKTGNQIPTDSIIIDGCIQVDESFLTGEPDSIEKKENDKILSGSFIVSGKCLAKVQHVGNDNYAAKISHDAKYIKKSNSEIMNSLQHIIRILSIVIIPLGILLFYTQLNVEHLSFQNAVVKSVAGIIALIPEGLVLLTTTVLAVSVIKLSKSKVLVQELYCIETLARVDTLCLDKTGTLTEGKLEVKDIIPISKKQNEFENIIANIGNSSSDENSTICAIREKFPKVKTKFNFLEKENFSSQTKWSSITFENEGTYILGAPEFVLGDNYNNHKNIIEKYTSDYRVLVIAHTDSKIINHQLPSTTNLIGLILILDQIRPEAYQTLHYFKKQGVDIKIISGDNPITVSKIAKQLHIENYDKYIDMSKIDDTPEAINNAAENYTIFGRVSPIQKKMLVVSLQAQGRTVAMTGDGVNDVLALKEADCSIAMANGSDATKSISQLVLLDSNFSSLPKVVAEGRQTINNIQRSASLFLVKTVYSFILAIMTLFMGMTYPFEPVQISLISIITIGIPSFLLALEPNHERISGKFLKNVIIKAFPTGLTVAINIFILFLLNKYNIIPNNQFSSLCVISTGLCGLILLFSMSRTQKNEDSPLPISPFRLSLALVLTILFFMGLIFLDWWFNIIPLTEIKIEIIQLFLLSLINYTILTFAFNHIKKH